jgi:predicted Fe-Mo cluster-binding NifX family protein
MVVGGIGPDAIMKLNAMGVKVFRAVAATVGENLEAARQHYELAVF